MTTRKKFLLLAAATLSCGVLWWSAGENAPMASSRLTASRSIVRDAQRDLEATRGDESAAVATAVVVSAPTRREALERVKALYRKEQLTRELDLEQTRYGPTYWQSERGGRELAKLQEAREALLKELSSEATQVLNDLFPVDAGKPGEAGDPIVLVALFDEERAGPNLTFLSPSVREKFEAEILAANSDAVGLEREQLLAMAERMLPASEMNAYRQWNEPVVAALRGQLVGFNPTEIEFTAIARDARFTDEEREGSGIVAGLEAQLGTPRFSEFLKLKDPAMQTALHELRRRGLPLDDAEWLAATRARAIATIGEIWQSAALTDEMKRQQVAQTQRAYGQAIAAKLALPESDLDGLDPSS